jgi:hypothetical protein
MVYRKTSDGIYQVSDRNVNLGSSKDTKSADQAQQDANRPEAVQSPCKNDGTKAIQSIIQNLQNDISNIQRYTNRFSTINGAVSVFVNEDSGVGKDIKTIVDFATTDIGSNIKTMLDPMRAWTINEIQRKAKETMPFLFPGEVPSFVDNLRKGTNLISCAFGKVIETLFGTIGDLLLQFIDQFINGPLCAIQDFISNLFDSILGPIVDSINSALSLITGTIGDIASKLFNALDFVNDLINFFKCETKPECPSVDSINLAGTVFSTDALNLQSSPPENFKYNSSGIGTLPIPGCPTNPIPCGPPQVQFFGGGGFGAAANPIISSNSSSVIGFDIVNPGTGFLEAPKATLVDSCGNGSGSSLQVIMEPAGIGTTSIIGIGTTSTLKVKNIAILAPGDGYLSTLDGSMGGNGRVWKEKDECYVETSDGKYYVVPDKNAVQLNDGDTLICSPPASEVDSYQVVTEIEDILVLDSGFGYEPGDSLEVVPSNGSQIEPVINDRGEIERINIINPGIGFTDIPEIFVKSKNGYNVKLVPVLKSTRISNLDPTIVPPGTQIISVVDCVGRILPKTTFNRVPR